MGLSASGFIESFRTAVLGATLVSYVSLSECHAACRSADLLDLKKAIDDVIKARRKVKDEIVDLEHFSNFDPDPDDGIIVVNGQFFTFANAHP